MREMSVSICSSSCLKKKMVPVIALQVLLIGYIFLTTEKSHFVDLTNSYLSRPV